MKLLVVLFINQNICSNKNFQSQYFRKPYEPFGGDINVKVDSSNHATKLDLKHATGSDTSKLAAKSDLASLKSEVDKIDIDKLKTVSTELSKLSNVVKNKKKLCMINQLQK